MKQVVRLVSGLLLAFTFMLANVPANAQTGSVLFQGVNGPAQDWLNFYWDATNHWLGICTNRPEYPLHIVNCGGGYATRAVVENANNGSTAYANWVAENDLGDVGVFGITSSNYNVFPFLQGRTYVLDAGAQGLTIATLGNTPVIFGIAGQQTGMIDPASKRMQSNAGFQSGSAAGISKIVTIGASQLGCTMTFTGGLLTGGSC